MTLAVVLIVGPVVVGVVLAFSALVRPGPSRPVTAVARYGIAPYAFLVAVLGAAVGAVLYPTLRADIASLGALAVVGWLVANRRRHVVRRIMIRSRWPSVARSCGLGIRRDVRGRSWPFDSTITLGNEHVESLPVISRPRLVPGVGVQYKLTPARGGTIVDVAQASEGLAAALRLQRVEVRRINPSQGELLAVFR